MSDHNHPHANGGGDPSEIPARELATWWDRRTVERRTGATDTPLREPTVAAIAQLDALVRADELSAPRPGFLDQLERQIMQTPQAMPATPIAVRRPEPLPTIPFARPHRWNRGLVDILTVAAVLALLLGGSWTVFNERANAPTPDGQNGVAGVSTPDDSPQSTPNGNRIAVLDQPWIEALPDVAINGVQPVSADECVTPSREAGSVEAAVQERRNLGEAAPTIEPAFLPGARINPDVYRLASEQDAEAMTSFFRQLSACRFDTGDPNGTELVPYTGAYWNLYADAAFSFDQATLANRDVDEVVREEYSFRSSYIYGWSYPATVLDVRQALPDSKGQPRLLVTTIGFSTVVGETTSLMVQEDGQWRLLIADVVPGVYGSPVAAFVVDVVLGADGASPRISGNYNGQIEADFPVAMTIANVGETPQQVSVAGQDLGVVTSGSSIIVQPFRVRPEAVDETDGYFIFEIEAVDQGASPGDPVARPVPIAVYAAGSLPYGPVEAGRATPSPATVTEASHDSAATAIASTPVSTPATETPVAVTLAVEPDRVVEIDQPWAVSTGTDLVNGIVPVDVSQCTIEPRATGALLDLVEGSSTRPVAEFPDYLLTSGMDALFDQYPEGTDADLEAALGFFSEWSACRFEVGSPDLPLEDRYTGAFYALRSDDNLLMEVPEGDGRTAESLVRQVRLNSILTVIGPYPDEVLDVRVYPADDRSQARLLVLHRNVAGTPYDQVSLLVLENGTWRLAERPDLLYSSTPATPGMTPLNVRPVMTLNLDIANPDVTSFVDWALSDTPVAVTITNSGSMPSPVMLGEQDLGVIGPGETIRVVPFTIPTSVLDDGNGGFQLTVSFTGADGADQRQSWSIHPIDDPIWGNLT